MGIVLVGAIGFALTGVGAWLLVREADRADAEDQERMLQADFDRWNTV